MTHSSVVLANSYVVLVSEAGNFSTNCMQTIVLGIDRRGTGLLGFPPQGRAVVQRRAFGPERGDPQIDLLDGPHRGERREAIPCFAALGGLDGHQALGGLRLRRRHRIVTR